jgi:hypothetical protein
VQSLLGLRAIDEQLHSQIHGVYEIMEEGGMDLDERREVLREGMDRSMESYSSENFAAIVCIVFCAVQSTTIKSGF